MTMTRIRPKADLIYGASGTRKTSNIGLVAMYVWKKYHKKTRMITLDGGGYDPLLSLVEEGIIDPWVLIARTKLNTNVIDLAMQGYWPKDTNDPNSPLVSPTPATWEEYGYYAIEGLTSIGDNIIRILKRDKASLSQDPSYTYSEESVEVDGKKRTIGYSGGNMTYFGFAQDQLLDFVMKTHVLPVEKLTWSALEGKGEEEGTRMPVFGPAIVGRKSTGKATQWFGNSVHIEQMITEEEDKVNKGQTNIIERPVMYTRTHAGKDRIPFPCKTRAPFQLAVKMPTTFDPPDMAALYRKLDELNEEAIRDVKKVMVPVTGSGAVGGVAEVGKQRDTVVDGVSTPVGSAAGGNPSTVSAAVVADPTVTTAAPDAFKSVDEAVIEHKPLSPVAADAIKVVENTFIPPRVSLKKPS